MPSVFRSMTKDANGFLVIGKSATKLGVRIPKDIAPNLTGNVECKGEGMSVAPEWRKLPLSFIPMRLGTGGLGKDSYFCFKMGDGPFASGPLAQGLDLLPDSPKHGVVRPAAEVCLAQYESDLAATQTRYTDAVGAV